MAKSALNSAALGSFAWSLYCSALHTFWQALCTMTVFFSMADRHGQADMCHTAISGPQTTDLFFSFPALPSVSILPVCGEVSSDFMACCNGNLLLFFCRRYFSLFSSILAVLLFVIYTVSPETIRTGGFTEEDALFCDSGLLDNSTGAGSFPA